jgi:hypothetical protein
MTRDVRRARFRGELAAVPLAAVLAAVPLAAVLAAVPLAAVLAAVPLAVGAPGLAAGPAGAVTAAVTGAPSAAASACRSGSHPLLAALMSAQIAAVLRQRASAVGLAVSDPATGVTCELAASRQFDSASIVKATILAALLHGDNAQPSAGERAHATAMITESDNNAATDLWNDVGPLAMRQFLNLAKMTQTVPGTGGYWGLTQVTARDQMKLLHLLTMSNGVLSRAARSYELGLMAQVDPAQRWGVSAGVPAGMTVELKNGWLPRQMLGWRINSIGCVSGEAARPERAPATGTPAAVTPTTVTVTSPGGQGEGREYCLVVLTEDNPTMAYGVKTVSEVARVVNTDLTSPLPTAAPGSPAGSQPAAPSAQAPADALTLAGLTAAEVRSAGLGPMGLRVPVPPAAPPRPSMLSRLWAGIAAGAVALALFAVGARLQVKRARRLTQPTE